MSNYYEHYTCVEAPNQTCVVILKQYPPLATTIQSQRYGLVCEGNLSFESCVEGKS